MTNAERFRPRQIEVEAMQFVLGRTTKQQVKEFCPSANVGISGTSNLTTDIRWVILPNGEEVRNTDWILKDLVRGWSVIDNEDFTATYETVGGE